MNPLWDNLFRRSKSDSDLHTHLESNVLFQDLSGRDLRFIEKLVHVRKYHSGEPVFTQGDIGVGMYIILSGRVEIFVTDPHMTLEEHREIFITQLLPSDFFGELSLVEDSGRRTATAIAKEETILIGFFRPDLAKVLSRKPGVGTKIVVRLAEVLGRRLKDTTDKVSDLRRALKEMREPPPPSTFSKGSTLDLELNRSADHGNRS
jgi:CRP-like cAMP-binding protein